jgi:hypothetical protein
MTRISYAQNGEDIVLYRAFGQQSEGFYIDIGANDPDTCSVTRLFSEAGWRGINVEPVPALAERLRTVRPREARPRELGPTSLAIAHRLHRLGQRFPRTGTLVKRVLHQVVKKAGLAR